MKIELKILNKDFYSSMTDGRFVEVRVDNLPQYATSGSAGVDLRATKDYVIYPGETVAIPTGIAIHIASGNKDFSLYRTDVGEQQSEIDSLEDVGIMGVIVPRSGKGSNEGLVLANLVGILDDDYQGEIIIQAWNRKNKEYLAPTFHESWGVTDKNAIKIQAGDRITQLVFVPIVKAQFNIVEEFTHNTDRGTGGFGSSGK